LSVFCFFIAFKAGAKIQILFNTGKKDTELFLFLTKKYKFGRLPHYL